MASKRRTSPAPDLSVVIVNYNVREFLQHALTSLQQASRGLKVEIIVVDNASNDGSVAMVRDRFRRVRLIVNPENVGFARANNIGIAEARGAHLLLINPDTVVQENTLVRMLEFMRSHPEAGLAGCKILNPDGSFQLPCRRSFPTPWVAFTKIFGLSAIFPRSRLFGRYNLTYRDIGDTYEVDAVSGSFMMVRREVIDAVGGLDETFFMYGEDLDWCYRIQSAGWKVYYVHTTSIIHYKGESTRRSNLDEVKTFYHAMYLFVEKHFRHSTFFKWILKAGIALVSFGAFLKVQLKPLAVSIVDILAVNASLLLGEFLRQGTVNMYPAHAMPIVYVIPAVIVVLSLYNAGVYTRHRMSISRSAMAVVFAYVIIAALTAFFRAYAFSRIIVLISAGVSLLLVPGWRLAVRLFGRPAIHGKSSLFGRRTLIVGTGREARQLLHRIRGGVAHGYEVVGFIGSTNAQVGSVIEHIPVLASADSVQRVIKTQKVSDVIFSPKAFTYGQILSVVAASSGQPVNFHLVPDTMDVIMGKASIDSLDELPLVEISYNIRKPWNIVSKRLLDLLLGAALLITVYPFLYFNSVLGNGRPASRWLQLPAVMAGRRSLVGPIDGMMGDEAVFLGKPGIVGLVQMQKDRHLTKEEIGQYQLFYARNQSMQLDLEILLKSWATVRRQQEK